ncbi:MAG: hypothetical protein WBF13_01385, partial [Candidatus Zixiibacteriota bacterium]
SKALRLFFAKAKALSSRKGEKSRGGSRKRASRTTHGGADKTVVLPDAAKRERSFEIFVTASLFAFGVYTSLFVFRPFDRPQPGFRGDLPCGPGTAVFQDSHKF